MISRVVEVEKTRYQCPGQAITKPVQNYHRRLHMFAADVKRAQEERKTVP
jgi:hypothetical protein